jgi:hypothetical protein
MPGFFTMQFVKILKSAEGYNAAGTRCFIFQLQFKPGEDDIVYMEDKRVLSFAGELGRHWYTYEQVTTHRGGRNCLMEWAK